MTLSVVTRVLKVLILAQQGPPAAQQQGSGAEEEARRTCASSWRQKGGTRLCFPGLKSKIHDFAFSANFLCLVKFIHDIALGNVTLQIVHYPLGATRPKGCTAWLLWVTGTPSYGDRLGESCRAHRMRGEENQGCRVLGSRGVGS
jgi:hypothetical protein